MRDKRAEMAGIAVIFISLIVLVPFARLGVDTHHDGVMFAAAMAVRHGYRVQSEAYSQYGPVVTWFQAILLSLFGDRLLVLKLASAVALALSNGLFAYFFSRRAGLACGLITSLIWLGCFPGFDDEFMMLVWSSDYLLLLFSLVLVLLALSEDLQGRSQTTLQVLSGFMLGLAPFVRVNSGLPVLLACGAGAVLFTKRSTARNLVMGIAAALLTILGYFSLTGGLGAWFEQTIVFPQKLYVGQMKQTGFDGLKGNSVVNGIPAIGTFALVLFFSTLFRTRGKIDSLRDFFIGLSKFVSLIVTLWLLRDGPKVGFIEPRLLLWGVLPGGVAITPLLISDLLEKERAQQTISSVVFAGVATLGLIQIFPVTDRRHLWWAVLPMIGGIALVLHRRMDYKRFLLAGSLVVLLLLPQSVSNARTSLSLHRQEMPGVPVLNGLLVSDDFKQAFGFQFQSLQYYQHRYGNRPVLNLCMDGFFATIGGRFAMPDPYYVYWGFPRAVWSDEARRAWVSEVQPFIWLCPPISDFGDTATSYGYRVVPRDVCIPNEDRFKAWPLIGQLAVPNNWTTSEAEDRVSSLVRCQY